ncbi:Solute carrier family 22 member 6-A [Dissostichus eleginoides]|uniref:Solute carrier family 22 member 6-A n=1 Tax=Dissostichus eleginoides TaxID=100907 RepID=A0AAD9B798_DISEL|nr:Solute carrier family 22 member 6-A [Dissostichus eleginoides]
MGFAELLEEAGGFGRYQWLHVTLISLPGLMMASQNLLNNFVSGSPPPLQPTDQSQQPIQPVPLPVDEKQLLRAFIPMDSSGSRLDRCRRFVEPQWQLLAANSSANVSQIPTEGCLDGWAYDRSEFLSTTVSEMIQTIYMGGVLTGAIVYGGLSDRYGRRSVLIWSYLQLGVLGCSSAFSPSYSTYCAFRFLSGMAVSGVILNGVSLSTMILAGLAYWLRDWRKLQLVVCLPQFLFFSYSWSVPFKIKASAPVPVLLLLLITKRHWAGSGPHLADDLARIRQTDSVRCPNAHRPETGSDPQNGSAADMGQHWSSSVSIWFSTFQIRYGPTFQMRYGSAYQTRYGCLPDYCQLQVLPYLRHLNTLNLANIGYI